jgi:competence protein ComEC
LIHPDARRDAPAITLFISFVFAIAAAPHLVQRELPILPLGLAAALSCAVRSERFRDARVALIGLAAGLLAVHCERESIAPARFDSARFAVVEGDVTGRFRCEDDRCLGRIENVLVTQDGRSSAFESCDLTVPLEALPLGDRVSVEGFIREDRGSIRVSVKSTQLVRSIGTRDSLAPHFWRRRLAARLGDRGEADGRSLIEAIALGERNAISLAQKRRYRDAGIYHLLVFSGMQISVAATILLFIFRAPSFPRLGDWFVLTFSIIAPWIAGNEPSVARASLMIGLDAFSRILHRPTPYLNLLFVTAILRLATHPSEITDASFLLTYAATGGLLLIGRAIQSDSRTARVASLLAAGFAAELAIGAVTRTFFHQWTIGSSVITLLVSPLYTLVLILAFMAIAASFVAAPLVVVLVDLVARIERLALAICEFLLEFVDIVRVATAPPILLSIGAFASSLVVFASVPRKWRLLAIAPLLLTLIGTSPAARRDSLHILDVGQGDAALVQTGGRAILIDAGPAARGIGLPPSVIALAKIGADRIDLLVITHDHPDHCGGAKEVIRHFRVARLVVPATQAGEPCIAETVVDAARRGLRVDRMPRESMVAEGTTILRTPRLRFKSSRINNESILVTSRIGRNRVVLAGDLEKDGERFWTWELDREDLRGSILKVAHHGSQTSTTETMLDAVAPRIALVSAGRENGFGHPHRVVVERLASRSARIFTTAESGTLRVDFTPRSMLVRPEFDSHFRGVYHR